MSVPIVTVLMAVYNGENHLRPTIESILNQTFKDFEFVIVNDGSTNSTSDIIKSYKDPRIVLHDNKTNIGQTKSLNIGLNISRGKYIARTDAGDISLPMRLEKQVKYLENNSARHDFLEAVASFITELEKWANKIQEDNRAEQVLSEVQGILEKLANRLPKSKRDKDEMLRANVQLSECEGRLKTHEKTLKSLKGLADEWSMTKGLLKDCKTLVKDALKTTVEAQRKVEKDVVKVVQSEARSKKKKRKPKVEDVPTHLVAALQSCGINLPDDAQRAIQLFEDELLLDQVKRATYLALLAQFVELLEEEL